MGPFPGDVAGLTSLRLRRLVWFLRRWNLCNTAHALEQETGVSYLRLLLVTQKWEQAYAYVEGQVDPAAASSMAAMILSRIHIFGIMAKFSRGEASTVSDASFQRADATLLASPELHPARRVLHTLRSDPFKARIQYGHISRGAVEAVLKWAAKCPELNAKTLSRPRCPFDYTYVVSLGARFWERGRRGKKNRIGRRIPAHSTHPCPLFCAKEHWKPGRCC